MARKFRTRAVDFFTDECELSLRQAQQYAEAEYWAWDNEYTFDWDVSPENSSSFSDEKPAWNLWDCVMRDREGTVAQVLGAIDFGRDGEPWGDPYAREVEAELAIQEMPK